MPRNTISNNFDFLRFVAAYMVLFSHQLVLTGNSGPNITSFDLGKLGVVIFFSISGYLVTQSWDHDPSIWRFLAKRMLRIWPALIVVTCITVLFLGPIVSTEPINHYFINHKTWDYFRVLKLIIRYELPGVFVTNPFPNAVNGSLWTLPIEFRWYLILMALGVVGLLRNRFLLLIAVTALAIFVFVIKDAQNNPDWKLHLQLGVFFAMEYACITSDRSSLHTQHQYCSLSA